jgi:hypothetical protein
MSGAIITDAERLREFVREIDHRIAMLHCLKQLHILGQPELPRGTVIKVNRKLRQLRNLRDLARPGAVDWQDLLSTI